MPATSRCVRFREFSFDPVARQLTRRGPDGDSEPVAVGSRALDVLTALLGRPGELVSKDEIMREVWPDVAVEENNLTVHISALRRILDAGGKGGSAIQTTSGRGYRFVPPVEVVELDPTPSEEPVSPAPGLRRPWSQPWTQPWGKMTAIVACAALLVALGWRGSAIGWTSVPALPSLSVAMLPFAAIGGTAEGTSAAAMLSEEVASALGGVEGAFVVSGTATQGIDGANAAPASVRRAFGVRYLIAGSVTEEQGQIVLDLALEDTASNASLWTGHVKAACPDIKPTRCLDDAAVNHIQTALLDAEARRIDGLPQETLTPAELMAAVEASDRHPVGEAVSARDVSRLERLLELEPGSAPAMVRLGQELLRPALSFAMADRGSARLLRAEDLAARARAIAPSSHELLMLQAQILRAEERWEEARAAFSDLLKQQPHNSFLANQLAICLRALGRDEESAAVLRDALAAHPGFVQNWALQNNLASALFQLGRYEEVVPLSLAALQSTPVVKTLQRLHLAAAYALLGQRDDAARQVALLRRTVPWPSARTLVRGMIDPPAARSRLAEGLVKAGVPDHIDEQIPGGEPSSTGIRIDAQHSVTPVGAPGIETLSTDELRDRLKPGLPMSVLLTTCGCDDQAPSGAIQAPAFREGAAVSEADRHRLLHWAVSLTKGNRDAPLVVIGANAASWMPRNFALSLAALGWRHVAWYRGGLDAWEASGAPAVVSTGQP